MKSWRHPLFSVGLPLMVGVGFLAFWMLVWRLHLLSASAFPSPLAVGKVFIVECRSGRVLNDLIISLFRVFSGFGLAVLLGIPAGLCMGLNETLRVAFLPAVNFLRNLSPLAWIPFAILWFGVGDAPAIFLIFLGSLFPVILATTAAVAGIPSVYLRVAREYGLTGWERLWKTTLPAIMPQIVTTLRVAAGISWVVVVAAEMIAGRDGLGFAVMDSRNGLRSDILVFEMLVIGMVGVAIDRALVQLTNLPALRWGYDR